MSHPCSHISSPQGHSGTTPTTPETTHHQEEHPDLCTNLCTGSREAADGIH